MTEKDFEKYNKYFKHEEFASHDLPKNTKSGLNMDQEFMDKLYHARDIAQVPFNITSAYRTTKYNKQVGGVSDSSHILGKAVDIEADNSRYRFKIVSALLESGFTRIGIGERFIHVDNDSKKSQKVIWGYYEKSE